ncbi:hypothetical protein KIP68_09810 [Corynebacterium aquatimens]|uniref:Rib/alpha-like domain-containing protein n=1 Tax=Corynebacterium aquatimens TaxID=1190508 RepID=UPI003D6F133C
MPKRSPFRAAIAGLTAIAIAATPLTVPNQTVLSAAVANAADTRTVTVTGPDNVTITTAETFTVKVSGVTGGKVQLYLDNVAQGNPVELSASGEATPSITPRSYGDHTLTARFIDADGSNPIEDGIKNFKTPYPTEIRLANAGADLTEYDSYHGFTINGKATTPTDLPVLEAGDTYTVRGNMRWDTASGRFYEVAINPPVGSTYVDNSARKLNGNNEDTSWAVGSRGTDTGTVAGQLGNKYYYPYWGETKEGTTYPTINPGYVGMQSTKSYDAFNNYVYDLEAKFKVPEAPGIHVPQFAVYKYKYNFHTLVPMNGAAFKVEAPKLPDRVTQTGVYNAQAAAQDTPPEITEGDTLADAKGFVADADKLPEGTTYDWTTQPTVANPIGVITVTYPDGSTDTVNVPFEVKTKPATTTTVTSTATTTTAATTTAATTTTATSTATTTTAATTPAATTTTATSTATSTTAATTPATPTTVTSTSGTTSTAATSTAGTTTTSATSTDTTPTTGTTGGNTGGNTGTTPTPEAPKAKSNPAPVQAGETPNAEDFVDNVPAGAKVTWKGEAPKAPAGATTPVTVDATVLITKDGTTTEVPVKVTFTGKSDGAKPVAKPAPAKVAAGATPKAADFVNNIPAGGSAEWKDGTPTTSGNYIVVVKDKNGAVISEVPVTVTFETTQKPAGDKGSSVTAEGRGVIIGSTIGALLSLAVLIGSQTNIQGINAAIDNVQRQLGIYNPQLASEVKNGLPIFGAIAGIAGLIGAIVPVALGVKDGKITFTVKKTQ